ncbi:MAG: hypothetical protein MJK12_14440 [Colwellia sp.]|nr:hypothetical protein [Colwellia sp.]
MIKTSEELYVIQNNQQIFEAANKPKALFVLAHGAGADMSHEFMADFSARLITENISVLRFNFPFMVKRSEDGKRRPPDRMPKLLESYLSILSTINTTLPIYIGGKSMGGRVAATLMNETISHDYFAKICGAVCLGYPFHPQKKPEKLRLEPLQAAQKNILIIQGERDALGGKEEIDDYKLSQFCQVVFVEDGDHNLKPRVKSGYTHQQHINTAIKTIVRFIDENN